MSELAVGVMVRVKEWADIPAVFRPNRKPSEGVVDRIEESHVIVIVDGKAVPYQASELEVVTDWSRP